VYEQKCRVCHGAKGAGQPNDRLVGGQGTLASKAPVRTIGSYWPYATTVFDYVRRSMPYIQPQSLNDNEVYAVTAYLLNLNGIIGENDEMNQPWLRLALPRPYSAGQRRMRFRLPQVPHVRGSRTPRVHLTARRQGRKITAR